MPLFPASTPMAKNRLVATISMVITLSLIAFLSAMEVASATGGTDVHPPPLSLNVDRFYKKYCNANGLPVLGSAKVSDEAMMAARDIVVAMLSKRGDVLETLKGQNVRIAVMAPDEVTTDIPEHSDLNRVFPQTNWNTRCRGVGATVARPVCSCAQENILQYPDDRYRGENILIHEFGHTLLNMGVAVLDPDFPKRVQSAYKEARQRGLWNNTYAASNWEEYWAEGVQDWFDANMHSSPANGIHNEIYTQAQLWKYDPALARLLSEVLPADLKWDGRTRLVPR